jgi:hypothetical protein
MIRFMLGLEVWLEKEDDESILNVQLSRSYCLTWVKKEQSEKCICLFDMKRTLIVFKTPEEQFYWLKFQEGLQEKPCE